MGQLHTVHHGRIPKPKANVVPALPRPLPPTCTELGRTYGCSTGSPSGVVQCTALPVAATVCAQRLSHSLTAFALANTWLMQSNVELARYCATCGWAARGGGWVRAKIRQQSEG